MIQLLNNFDLSAVERLYKAIDTAVYGEDDKRQFVDTIAYKDEAYSGFTADQRNTIRNTFIDECNSIVFEIEQNKRSGVDTNTVLFPKNRKGLESPKAFYRRFTQVMAMPQYDVSILLADNSKPNYGLPVSECSQKPAMISLISTNNGVDEEHQAAAFVIVDTFADYLSGTVPLPKSMLFDCNTHEYGIPDESIAAKWLGSPDKRTSKLYSDTVKSIGLNDCIYAGGKERLQFYVVFLAATFVYQKYLENTVGLPETTVQGSFSSVCVPNDVISNDMYHRNVVLNKKREIIASAPGQDLIKISNTIVTVAGDAGMTFTRPLSPFDRVMVNHIVTLWIQSGAEKTGERPYITGKQLYERTHGGRYSGYISKETLQDFKQYCKELATVAIDAEYSEMAHKWNKGKNIDAFRALSTAKDGYSFELFDQLVPIKILTVKNKGVETWGIQIKEKPAILTFAQATGQYFDYSEKYLEIYKYDADKKRGKPIPSSDLVSVLADHLARCVTRMKNDLKKSKTGTIPDASRTIKYDTIYTLAAETTGKDELARNEAKRIRDTVGCILESWKQSDPQLIKDYVQITEPRTAGKEKMHKLAGIVITL